MREEIGGGGFAAAVIVEHEHPVFLCPGAAVFGTHIGVTFGDEQIGVVYDPVPGRNDRVGVVVKLAVDGCAGVSKSTSGGADRFATGEVVYRNVAGASTSEADVAVCEEDIG